MKKLSYEDLKHEYNFEFIKLSEVEPINYSSLQPRVLSAFSRLGSPANQNKSQIIILEGYPGIDYEDVVTQLISNPKIPLHQRPIFDLCYAENLVNSQRPVCLELEPGTGPEFCEKVSSLLKNLLKHVDSENIVESIMKHQPGNDRLASYLSDLSVHVANELPFDNDVIINLMVTHKKNTVPVIYGRDLNWFSLFGKVNYLTEQGTVYSNQNLLEPGLVRRANGGYLILPISELVRQPGLWYKLSNAVAQGVLDWESNYQEGNNLVPFFEPEPTLINLNLVLVGDYIDISDFYSLDIDAIENIELKSDLIHTIDSSRIAEFVGFLRYIQDSYELMDFTADAVKILCDYSSRQCGTRTEFSIVETRIAAVMKLAHDIAYENGHEMATGSDVKSALKEREFRANHAVEESSKMYREHQMLISTSGECIGQINGMSVVSTAGTDFEYGEPLRITATVHAGDGDIFDVEHKANLAGQIHQKAMMIINGYIANNFARNDSLPFTINLVFEQSYSEIDGDSASLSGLCSVLSAMANAPIDQSLAVTGALDQFGHVQPVGGLNEKIEGFYRVCKIQGITGKQGVIIPATNVNQLILSDEVLDAIRDEKFSIYIVDTLAETLEILTGIKCGTVDEPDTLFGRIQERIDEMNGKPVSFWSRLFG